MISPSWHSYQEGRIDMQPIGAQKRLSESSITQQAVVSLVLERLKYFTFRAVNAMKRTGGDHLSVDI